MSNELNFDAFVSVSEVNKELNASIKSRKKNMGIYDNYPPGVTGNEFAIAGPDHEWEEEFECSNDQFEHVKIEPYLFELCKDILGNLNYKIIGQPFPEELYRKMGAIHNAIALSDIDYKEEIAECGYTGIVFKQSYNKEVWWNCPRCGQHYEERIEPYHYDD